MAAPSGVHEHQQAARRRRERGGSLGQAFSRTKFRCRWPSVFVRALWYVVRPLRGDPIKGAGAPKEARPGHRL
eukprot:6474226-Amphidinium_carterae.1